MPRTKSLLLLAVLFLLAWTIFKRFSPDSIDRLSEQPSAAPEKSVESAPAEFREELPISQIPSEVSSSTTAIISLEEIEKTRRAIQVSLSSAYTAEKAYFAEFGTYSTDLRAVGWIPSESELRFKMGFTEASLDPLAEGEDPDQKSTESFVNSIDESDPRKYTYAPTGQGIDLEDARHLCSERCTATRDRFEILAIANLDADATLDVWLINDAKELIQVSDDLKE